MSSTSFRTTLKPKPQKEQIDYKSRLVLFGSCFSENIGQKLAYFKFQELTNPYGILFNPIAIENAIQDCVQNRKYTEKDVFFFNELFHSYKHHSDFSETSSEIILGKINQTISKTHEALKNGSHLIVTLGTSWVYKLKETNAIVANCHKVPQKEFSKELLSVQQITDCLKRIQKRVLEFNPSIKIVFTVSPVRHIKDGIVENSRSKAHLLSAIHETIDSSNSFYFPAYEIVLDDLRDYRFYEKDMLHPNEVAVDYIWEFFKEEWIHKLAIELFKEIDTIQKGKLHKPFNVNSEAHQLFLKNLKAKIEQLYQKTGITF